MPSATDPVSRAFAAYFRDATRRGLPLPQPANTSGEASHEGLHYVVLHNVNGVLAVYRIKPDGLLRRLRSWPKAIEAY